MKIKQKSWNKEQYKVGFLNFKSKCFLEESYYNQTQVMPAHLEDIFNGNINRYKPYQTQLLNRVWFVFQENILND